MLCGMDPVPDVLDQHCESRQALDRIADKWTCLVVYALVDGPRRHGELRRPIDGISQEDAHPDAAQHGGRRARAADRFDVVPPAVEYRLTPLGETLEEPLVAICQWAMDHLPELQAARRANAR